MHFVTDATYAGGYTLKIQFDDGQVKLVNLGSHLDGTIFEPLKDIAYFKQFEVNRDIDTVVWPNDADFSPDFLYEIGTEISQTKGASR